MLRYVFDTNIFRYAHGDVGFRQRVEAYSPLAYSSVVLSELRRSAANDAARRRIAEIEKKATKATVLVVPSHQDWLHTGDFLATKVSRGGAVSSELLAYIQKLQNDALIAFSCWSRGFAVVTSNRDDFEDLRTFWGVAKNRLLVEPAPT